MYSPKVLQHFRHPKNMGKIKKPDAVGQAGNPVCGDIMKLYLKIKDQRIKDIKFETLGCAAAIANSSILTTMVKGKTLDQALKVTNQEIVQELGGLPPVKIHCSLLAVEALKKAIADFQKRAS